MTQDPIGFSGGLNLYNYAGGNSVNYIDPTGEFGLIGAGIGAGLDLALQLIENGGNFKCVSWTSVAVSGALGAVGGGFAGGRLGLATGKAVAKSVEVRKLYNKTLAEGLTKNFNVEQAWRYRRDVGEKMKNLTPLLFRYNIYVRNFIKYRDPLGPSLKATLAKGDSVEKILTGTSQNFNKVQNMVVNPETYADAGVVIGAVAGSATAVGATTTAVIRASDTGGCGCD